jgi:hypothetical protein
MCTLSRKFSRVEVYEAIQATVACVQGTSKLWFLKRKDTKNGLFFDIGPKLKLADYKINIIEYGGESIKLKSLIDQADTKGLILYEDYNFLPYPPNAPQLVTDFFNLFLGFLAKPASEINKKIMDLILWHMKNIISDENKKLHEYLWKW